MYQYQRHGTEVKQAFAMHSKMQKYYSVQQTALKNRTAPHHDMLPLSLESGKSNALVETLKHVVAHPDILLVVLEMDILRQKKQFDSQKIEVY